MPSNQTPVQLKKSISLWKGVALAVSTVIGSGILGLPGLALELGNIYSAAGGWILVSLMMIPLVYIFSFLGVKFTSSAGLAKYAHFSIGDFGNHAVTMVLCGTFVLGVPALSLIGAEYAQKMFALPTQAVYILAFLIILFSVIFNIRCLSIINIVHVLSLCLLIAMTLIIVLSNQLCFVAGLNVFSTTIKGTFHVDYHTTWKISALLFWAFLGWENLSFSTEEFKNPFKTIPAVYWSSFAIVIVLYLSLSITSIGAQHLGITTTGASGLTSLVENTPLGKYQIAIMIVIITANASAWIMGASRLYFAAGRDGVLPSFLGKLTKRAIPAASIVTSLIAYSLVLLVSYIFNLTISDLVMFVNQNYLVLYVVSMYAYVKSEKRRRKWVIAFSALISCGFLLSGFNWWICYPVLLVFIGYVSFRKKLRIKN